MRHGITLIAAAVMAATSAGAAERTGFYIGGDVGQSNWNVSEEDANNFAAAVADTIDFYGNGSVSVTGTEYKFSDTDTTFGLFVGYQFIK